MAAKIVHVPADAPAQSEDQRRRRRVKHQLAVDQLECSFFYTSYSQKSLLGLKRGIYSLTTLHVYNDMIFITFQTQQAFQRV